VVDASGVHAFRALWQRCRSRGIVLIVSGLQSQPRRVFAQMGLQRENGSLHFAANFEEALEIAADLPDPDPQA
jgi:SulP family sulfate permease